MKVMAEYGPGRIDEFLSLACVSIVRLIDFDRDGKYELFCAYDSMKSGYGADTQVIYGYDNESGVYTLLEASDVSWHSEQGPHISFLYKKGKKYFVDSSSFEVVTSSYYTVEGNNGVCVLEYEFIYTYKDKVPTALNDIKAGDEELWTAVEEFEGNGVLESIFLSGYFTYRDKEEIARDNQN